MLTTERRESHLWPTTSGSSQKDDDAWKIYDKQKTEFLTTSFNSRKQAIDLTNACENYHHELQHRATQR